MIMRRKRNLLSMALFGAFIFAILMDNKVCADEVPAGTQAPIIEPSAQIPDADYADIYIQALEQCGYTDGAAFDRAFVALDFDISPALTDEEMTRVCQNLQQKGYKTQTGDIKQLDKKGLVRHEDNQAWVLPDGEKVRLDVQGLVNPGELYVNCTVERNSYAGCDRTMIFTQQDGTWKYSKCKTNWYGDERYFPDKLLGDANGDEQIDLTDASAILRMALKITPKADDIFCLDVNDDGELTLQDAAETLKCALKLKPAGYYVSLIKDCVASELTDSVPEGVWIGATSAEAVRYLGEYNLVQPAQDISALNPARFENHKIMVVSTRVDAHNESDITTFPYIKTTGTKLSNHIVQEVAVGDDLDAVYVQVFLVDADCNIDKQQTEWETKENAGVRVIDGKPAETVTGEVVCSTYEQYMKQVEIMGGEWTYDFNSQYFEQNMIIFKKAQDVYVGDDAMNLLHITDDGITIENTSKSWERSGKMEDVCYVVNLPKTLVAEQGASIKIVKSSKYGYNKTDGIVFGVAAREDAYGKQVRLTEQTSQDAAALDKAAQSLGLADDELKKWQGAVRSFDFKRYDAICMRQSVPSSLKTSGTDTLAVCSSVKSKVLYLGFTTKTDKKVSVVTGGDLITLTPVPKGAELENVFVQPYDPIDP